MYKCKKIITKAKKTINILKIFSRQKSSRIEVLRRKYEAILLEDQKRKERNEYILEKLDKMRLCTSLTHNKYKPNFIGSSPAPFINRLIPLGVTNPEYNKQCYRSYQDISSNRPAPSLINEIKKQYILIPKRTPEQQEIHTNIEESNIHCIDVIENDWKSKYEILNKLKQEEKETAAVNSTETALPVHQQQNDYPKYTFQSEQESPEIAMTSKDEKGNKISDNDFPETVQFECPTTTNSNPADDVLERNIFENIRSPEEIAVIDKIIDGNKKAEYLPEISAETDTDDTLSKIEGSEKIEHLDDDGLNPAQISYASEKLGKPFGDIPTNTEDDHYPIEIINVEDFTPKEDVTVKDGVNVNPEEYGMDQSHFSVMEDDSKILEEDSSQSPKADKIKEPSKEPDMSLAPEQCNPAPNSQISEDILQNNLGPEHAQDFYVPNVDTGLETYTHEQGDPLYSGAENEIVYDQETAENMWSAPQVDNIQEHQYYYEGPHEQAESVHINEHEETCTPYDQNYEQQYAANYEQQGYDEMSQPFDPIQGQEYSQDQQQEIVQFDTSPMGQQQETFEHFDPNTMDYVQQQYEQENYGTLDQVEKELDQEQGFTEEQQQVRVEQ